MATLMLIDGNSLAHRAFYAIPALANREGFATNAIYGFMHMLNKIRKDEGPDYLVVAFDAGKWVFRHEIYENYKGSRKSTPDELRAQFPVLKELLDASGIARVELAGYEADDLIGTLAARGSAVGMQVRIITGDRDCFQLIDGNTAVLFTRKGISELERFDEGHLHEVYGLAPWQIVELKGLMGDSSDDIPGIPGIGEKTALKLLAEHDSVEGVLAAAGAYAGKKLGERLAAHRELARLSRRLAKIDRDVPVDVPMETLRPGRGDPAAKISLLRRLEFKGLLAEALAEQAEAGEDASGAAVMPGVSGMPGMPGIETSGVVAGVWTGAGTAQAAGSAAEAKTLFDAGALKEYLSGLREGQRLYILPVTVGQSWRSFTWAAFGLQAEGREPVWLAAEQAGGAGSFGGGADGREGGGDGSGGSGDDFSRGDYGGEGGNYGGGAAGGVAGFCGGESSCRDGAGGAPVLDVLRSYLESPGFTKVLFDVKQADLFFRASGLRLCPPCEDLHLMSYLLNPASPGQRLGELAELEPERLARAQKEAARQDGTYWSAAKAGALLRAMEALTGSLRAELEADRLLSLYETMEVPLAFLLAEMELRGICLAPEVLREQGKVLKEKISIAESEIYRMAGRQFNINSPKQLGEILFDEFKLPKGKKTKTGYSTDAETLENLAPEHAVVGRILEYRQYAKLQSTYVEGLLSIADRQTWKIHSSLNQTITVTGRLSSTEPNLQNIPIRMEEGRQIRKAFRPSPGCCLLSGDYSQIELRVLAHLCGDEALCRAFRQGQDIHRSTAAEVFGLAPEAVTPQLRRAAKAVNFGLIYGISDFGLAQDLGIGREEAKAYMERYFSRYPGVKQYFDRLLRDAEEKGYVETMFHRRRYLPELKSGNFHTRSFGRRAAMNAPVQGTAADIMKLAMVEAAKVLAEAGLAGTMVLQVHDELLFDMPREAAAEMKDRIKAVMEGVAALEVPLLADMKIGADWYAMEEC